MLMIDKKRFITNTRIFWSGESFLSFKAIFKLPAKGVSVKKKAVFTCFQNF